MNSQQHLRIELLGYWHSGAGRSSGQHLDALCERDGAGLPILPGRQLKGLLRHAVRRAEAWGWLHDNPLPDGPANSHEELLFGSTSQQETRDSTHPGLMFVGSAQLPEPDRTWLAGPEQHETRRALFGELFSTRIHAQTGTAAEGSLRGIEVAVPLILEAALEMTTSAVAAGRRQQQQAYIDRQTGWQVIARAVPLIDHVGGHRNRGLGEAIIQLSSASGA